MTALLSAATSAEPGGINGYLLHLNGTVAYALIGFLAFAEAALMVGFVFPGETAVVIGGVLAGLGRVNLVVMIVVVVVCAVVGDSVGYEVGRKAGPWLTTHRPLKGRSAVTATLALLDRYGGPAVFLGRFTAFARAMVPGLAGMSGLRYRTFLAWNVLGGICWSVGYTLLGYVVGLSFERILSQIGLWSLAVVAVVGAGVVTYEVQRRRRDRARIARELSVLDTEDDTDTDTADGTASDRAIHTDGLAGSGGGTDVVDRGRWSGSDASPDSDSGAGADADLGPTA